MYSARRSRRGMGFTSVGATYTPAEFAGATADIQAGMTCDPNKWGGAGLFANGPGDLACADAGTTLGYAGSRTGIPALWVFKNPAALPASAPVVSLSDCQGVVSGAIGTSSLDPNYVTACKALGVDISAVVNRNQAAAVPGVAPTVSGIQSIIQAVQATLPTPDAVSQAIQEITAAAPAAAAQALKNIQSATATATAGSGQNNYSFSSVLTAPLFDGIPVWGGLAALAAAAFVLFGGLK